MPSTSQPNRGSSSQLLYSSLSSVPLIKSPALRVPPPVTYPTSLHPLPDSIKEYFVYPFQLETFVMADRERREQRRRDEMRRLAPGYDEGAGPNSVLVPTTRALAPSSTALSAAPIGSSTGNDIDELLTQFEGFGTSARPSQSSGAESRPQS